MKPIRFIGSLTISFAVLGAAVSFAQAPTGRTGPSLQAPADPREPELLKTCKVPPPAAQGRGGGGRGPAGPPPGPKEYTVTEIPGVIAAGQKWTEVWRTDGNNADGIIATKDGGLLLAQNDNSQILKLKDGKTTVVYSGLNTSGAISESKKGVLFVNNRGFRASVDELSPKRRVHANSINGDPLDCIGGVLNDLTADSKGGVYFTMGGLYYADAKGVVKQYGKDLRTNGVILSPDEKVLYVTNGPAIAAFDVQKDGSLTNQREFAKLQGGGFGGDGSAVDSQGRLYVTSQAGIEAIASDGKYLGLIPTPRGVITTAFAGPDKKTLFAVIFVRDGDKSHDEIISIPMIAQGYRGRAK